MCPGSEMPWQLKRALELEAVRCKAEDRAGAGGDSALEGTRREEDRLGSPTDERKEPTEASSGKTRAAACPVPWHGHVDRDDAGMLAAVGSPHALTRHSDYVFACLGTGPSGDGVPSRCVLLSWHVRGVVDVPMRQPRVVPHAVAMLERGALPQASAGLHRCHSDWETGAVGGSRQAQGGPPSCSLGKLHLVCPSLASVQGSGPSFPPSLIEQADPSLGGFRRLADVGKGSSGEGKLGAKSELEGGAEQLGKAVTVGLGSIECPAAAVTRALRVLGGDTITPRDEEQEAVEARAVLRDGRSSAGAGGGAISGASSSGDGAGSWVDVQPPALPPRHPGGSVHAAARGRSASGAMGAEGCAERRAMLTALTKLQVEGIELEGGNWSLDGSEGTAGAGAQDSTNSWYDGSTGAGQDGADTSGIPAHVLARLQGGSSQGTQDAHGKAPAAEDTAASGFGSRPSARELPSMRPIWRLPVAAPREVLSLAAPARMATVSAPPTSLLLRSKSCGSRSGTVW